MHWSDAPASLRVNKSFRSHCEPGWRIDAAWSEALADLDLWVIQQGRGRLRHRLPGWPPAEVTLRRGVAVLLRPGGAYEAGHDPADPLVVDAVHFELDGPTAKWPPLALRVADPAWAEATMRRLRDRWLDTELRAEPAARTDRVSSATLRGLLLDLEEATRTEAIPAARQPHRGAVLRAEAQIRDRLANPPTIAELAAGAHLCPDHFARVFRRITGRSPQEARIQARIDRASHLLRRTPMTVSEIAAALGYRNAHFFSRQFKQRTGSSPKKHRIQSGG